MNHINEFLYTAKTIVGIAITILGAIGSIMAVGGILNLKLKVLENKLKLSKWVTICLIAVGSIFFIIALVIGIYTLKLVEVPNVEGKLYKDAKTILIKHDLEFNTVKGRDEDYVIAQSPKEGSIRTKKTIVQLTLEEIVPAPTEAPSTPTPSIEPSNEEWSEWTKDDTLTRTSNYEYQQEYKTEYAYKDRWTTTSNQKEMDGWNLYKTEEEWGEYGTWSDWNTVETEATNTVKVENKDQYRYRDKQFTTSNKSELSGWIAAGNDYEWSNYGAWSDWSSTAVSESETRKVETKTQYRYQDRQTTTGSNSTMAGWTLYDTTSTWGNWSEWTTNVLTAGEGEEVDTKVESITKTTTVYQYFNCYWVDPTGDWRETSLSLIERNYSGYSQRGTITLTDYRYTGTFTGSSSSPKTNRKYNVLYSAEYSSPLPYSENEGWRDSSGQVWWQDCSKEVSETETVIYYRKRAKVNTYHFYKWGTWSGWSDTAVTPTEIKNVETRILYRFATRAKEYTYSFWKWGSWSEWSDVVRYSSDTREIEKRTVYRYATRKKVYTYYFERYSDQSAWSLEKPEEKEGREILSQQALYYRYRLKGR